MVSEKKKSKKKSRYEEIQKMSEEDRLRYFLYLDNIKKVKKIIEESKDPKKMGGITLLEACRLSHGYDYYKMISMLIDQLKVDVNSRDIYYNSPLMFAIGFTDDYGRCNLRVIHKLLENGANIYFSNKAGETVRSLASNISDWSCREMVNIMLDVRKKKMIV